jgi:hypothetical protein
MNITDNVILLILFLLIIACDKKESSIEKPATGISIIFSGAINDSWENEEGWFVVNQLYILKDRDQLSITLSKGYTNLSIVYAAKKGTLQPGTYQFAATNSSEKEFAMAEYYVLGDKNIYKCHSGAITITEISHGRVKGFINGEFSLSGSKDELIVYGSFTVPPLY